MLSRGQAGQGARPVAVRGAGDGELPEQERLPDRVGVPDIVGSGLGEPQCLLVMSQGAGLVANILARCSAAATSAAVTSVVRRARAGGPLQQDASLRPARHRQGGQAVCGLARGPRHPRAVRDSQRG